MQTFEQNWMEEKNKHIGFTPWCKKWRNGELTRLNWDVVLSGGQEYFVYHLSTDFDNFDESDKEHYLDREDTWFICERDCPEDKIIENLISVGRRDLGVRWGINIEETAIIKTKWDDASLRQGVSYTITRNDKPLVEGRAGSIEGAYINARKTIFELEDSSAEIGTIDWEQKLIGRKIWYGNDAAIIDHVFGAEIWIVPDKQAHQDKFTTPESWKEESDWMDFSEYENGLKTEITSPKISWFRDAEWKKKSK